MQSLPLLAVNCVAVALLVSVSNVQAADSDPPRIALVIGNNDYRLIDRELNLTDADDVRARLERLGFEIEPGDYSDLGLAEMRERLAAFTAKLQTETYRNALALFYFSGHAYYDKRSPGAPNYLLPTDFKKDFRRKIGSDNAIYLDREIIEAMNPRGRGGANVIVLDSCRKPFRGRKGMADVDDIPDQTLIAFAAEFEQEAIADEGRNSFYTARLVEQLDRIIEKRPDTTVYELFTSVRISVETKSEQKPQVQGQLVDAANPRLAAATRVAAVSPGAVKDDWDRLSRLEVPTLCDYDDFIAKHAASEDYALLARQMRSELIKARNRKLQTVDTNPVVKQLKETWDKAERMCLEQRKLASN